MCTRLERVSGLNLMWIFLWAILQSAFNPGDKEHTVEKILKVTSGSTLEVGLKIDKLYQSVITAVHI
jgi:UDP-N-acetyl-D-galactosamine dehydrogenase